MRTRAKSDSTKMSGNEFTTVTRRRGVERGKEGGNGRNLNEKEKIGYQSVPSGFAKRPNAEWDYRSFAVIVAKADEEAIGAGLEKMISERRLIASYNWDVDSWIPTIVVPGAPKMFYPWPGGVLEVRNEVMTIDEESFRIPNSPMEPLFTAVRLCQPDFKVRLAVWLGCWVWMLMSLYAEWGAAGHVLVQVLVGQSRFQRAR